MNRPEGNGLFEVAGGKPKKERGFNCMKLIEFLTKDGKTDWDEWHGAHLQAAAGECPYHEECNIYARSIEKQKRIGIQLSLF